MKTTSGATAVQVVWSSRRGAREIGHLGPTHDEAMLEALKAAAQQRIAAGQLEPGLGLEPAGGGPLPITSSRMGCLPEYAQEDGGSGCRRPAPHTLAWGRPASCSTTCPRSTSRPTRVTGSASPVSPMERRLEPQITIGLLTGHDGFPLMVSAFGGNRTETKTMLSAIEKFMAARRLPDVTVVADAGMISEANQKAIEAAGLSFILGMKIPDAPYQPYQVAQLCHSPTCPGAVR